MRPFISSTCKSSDAQQQQPAAPVAFTDAWSPLVLAAPRQPLFEALNYFQTGRSHMALVVDGPTEARRTRSICRFRCSRHMDAHSSHDVLLRTLLCARL